MLKKKQKRGFTLMEVMMAIVIFAIFMGSLMNAYFNLITANRDADEVRQMYAGARDIFSTLSEDIRLSAVDYYSAQGADKSKVLYLLSKDGLKRTVYKVEQNKEAKDFLVISKAEAYRQAWQDVFPDSSETTIITPVDLLINDFQFIVTPAGDPYAKDSYNVWSNQFQPQVTIAAEFINDDEGVQFPFPLQTTISSRVYTKVDQRDQIYKIQ